MPKFSFERDATLASMASCPSTSTLGVRSMKSLPVHALLVAMLLTASSSFAGDSEPDPEWVSLINLIATPERYHNKEVFFRAYVTVEFENMSLCLTEHTLSSKDCLWLDIEQSPSSGARDPDRYKAIQAAWRHVNRQPVSVHGTFDKDNTGHLGGWSGAVKSVTRVNGKSAYIDFTSNPPLVRLRQRGDQVH